MAIFGMWFSSILPDQMDNWYNLRRAIVAQTAEQPLRKRRVKGSIPFDGFSLIYRLQRILPLAGENSEGFAAALKRFYMSSVPSRRVPSLWRIIQVDYTIFVLLFFPALVWISYFMTRALWPGGLWLAVAVSAACLAPLVLRLVTIYWLFWKGSALEGQIELSRFNKERGWVEVSYVFNGRNYRKSNPVFQSEQTQTFYPGIPVTILVDPRKPERALIKELFD
jgi:hypothetical protein